MIRLLYFSTALPHVDQAEVNRIVEHASEKNARLGVTGARAFNGRNFCQLLEGEPEAVTRLVETIKADPRHSGFKVLDQIEITERHFPGWDMQLVSDLDFSAVINAMNA